MRPEDLSIELIRLNKAFNAHMTYTTAAQIPQDFQWDEEGIFSFTARFVVRDICNRLMTLPGVTRASIISDITAGIGGSAIAFGSQFSNVRAVELSPARTHMLAHNLYTMDVHGVGVYCGDCRDFIANETPSDVIFFDPPWGGVDYKNKERLRLSLGVSDASGGLGTRHVESPRPLYSEDSTPIEQVIRDMRGKTNYCVVKLPTNYDIKYFADAINSFASIVHMQIYTKPYSSIIAIVDLAGLIVHKAKSLPRIVHKRTSGNTPRLADRELDDTDHTPNAMIPSRRLAFSIPQFPDTFPATSVNGDHQPILRHMYDDEKTQQIADNSYLQPLIVPTHESVKDLLATNHNSAIWRITDYGDPIIPPLKYNEPDSYLLRGLNDVGTDRVVENVDFSESSESDEIFDNQ
jgi:predicted RNA methylase